MASAPFPPVGINATALLTPLTGIGQYTLHLAREMQHLLPEPPWLFYARDWSREIRPPPVPSASSAVASIKGAIPYAYEMARMLQQRRFSSGARAHRIGLYHEPNYLALRFDGPTVVTIHDLSWVRHPETHPPERVRAMQRAMPEVVRRADQIVVDSDFVRGEVLAHYTVAPEKVTTVHLGVTPAFRPLQPAACEAALSRHALRFGEYVLAVGTLEPRKNIAAVIAAYGLLPQALRRRYPLVIAGMRGWGRREAPPEGVRLLGYVADELLPALYSGACVFVYPSLYEGFGLPPLEAMACGAPVIASRRASLPEILGGAGVLVNPLDESEIRDRILEVLEDGALRARLSAAGIERAEDFTWRRCAEGTRSVYGRAVGC